MPKRQPSARKTRSEAREEFLSRAETLWQNFDEWYQDNPEATFDEMEEELGKRRRDLLGSVVELSLRQGDLGAKPEALVCRDCGKQMKFKGYPKKTFHGLELDATIPRAYYYCSTCKVGFFPPGPSSPAEGR